MVIIGAGISGLMAGALLAKKDKKVLILESQPKIGGYLSGFERKGYYFDVGITRSNISYVEPYLREAGVCGSNPEWSTIEVMTLLQTSYE